MKFSFSGAQSVCHEHFEESCFEAELKTRLGFRRFKRPTPGALPTIINSNPIQSHVQQEGKGPEAHKKKARSVTSSFWKTISL